MGNPNGDFVDNSPRNFDGRVFTTDKCIKYNIRRYIHETVEDSDKQKDIVFFYPRKSPDAKESDAKYLTKDTIFKTIFEIVCHFLSWECERIVFKIHNIYFSDFALIIMNDIDIVETI